MLILYNKKRDLYIISILIDVDLIYIFRFYGSLIRLLSILLLILPLLDLLAYIAKSIQITFKYNLIPNINLTILTPFLKGRDNAYNRLLNYRPLVLLQVKLAGEQLVIQLRTKHFNIQERVEQLQRRFRSRIKGLINLVKERLQSLRKIHPLLQSLRILLCFIRPLAFLFLLLLRFFKYLARLY